MKIFSTIALTICLPVVTASGTAFGYATTVKGTVNLSISQADGGFAIDDTDRYLFLGHIDTLKIVDTGTLALTASQPPELTTEDGTEGNLKGVVYSTSNDRIYTPQDNGNMLSFSFNDITATPSIIEVAESKVLGPAAIDTSASPNVTYVGNSTDGIIYYLHAGTSSVAGQIALKSASEAGLTFTIKDMLYNDDTDEIYASTDIGRIYYAASGSDAASAIVIDPSKAMKFSGMAMNSAGTKIYVIEYEPNDAIHIISTSTHSETKVISVDSDDNTEFWDIAVMANPASTTAYYGYVSGEKGVTVFNLTTEELVDINTTTTGDYDPIPTSYYGYMVASSDSYIYLSSGGGEISVITERPYITVSTGYPKYYDSTGAEIASLQIGGTVVFVFQSDTAGTYSVRANGSIDQSGCLLTNTGGQTSGTVTAATDTTVTFAYDTNKTCFAEGTNIGFIFVSDSNSWVGRLGKNFTVDTPPDKVTLRSTDFGNGRAYVTFDRLTAADMAHYNIYADTDPAAVLTKTDVSATVSQPSSGSTVTGHAGSLTNGTVYYVAVAGVDATGNIGERGYLLPDGTQASAQPQRTVGPAGYSGETGGFGCGLAGTGEMPDAGCRTPVIVMGLTALCALIFKYRYRFFFRAIRSLFAHKTLLFLLLLLAFHCSPFASSAFAKEEEKSPQWWSVELKGGFWMPTASETKKFITNCCNLNFMLEGGFLYKGRYGVEIGAGFTNSGGNAKGVNTGANSGDTFSLIMIPMDTNLAMRFDFIDNQIVVPYLKGGVDYVYYRESVEGSTIDGMKYGLHSEAGLQFLIESIDTDQSLETDYGINDFYVIIGARYGWINSFGKKGLNLSGLTYNIGILFEF